MELDTKNPNEYDWIRKRLIESIDYHPGMDKQIEEFIQTYDNFKVKAEQMGIIWEEGFEDG